MPTPYTSWRELRPGMRLRWVTPQRVRVCQIVRIKKQSIVLLSQDGRHVLPDGLMYWLRGIQTPRPADDYLELAPPGTREGSHSPRAKPPQNSGDFDMSPSEAAAQFGVAAKDIRRWLRSGKVAGIQRSGGWWIDSISLGRFLSERSGDT